MVNVELIADKDSFNWHTFGRGDSHILGKKVLCLIPFFLQVCSESAPKFIVAVPCETGHHSLKSPLCQYGCELPVSVRREFVTEKKKKEFFPSTQFLTLTESG